ncbi:transporter substrate-binding domain-containing protein [Desulfococcaceae bacterium HSG8]|nr:transporter substrate-binding domain-containing protein [Desulfococcaceae bacterium HSG8]
MKTLCAIIFIVTALSGYGFAEERTYVVGVENINHYPHYALRDNEWVGFGREVLDAFAKKYGYMFKYEPYPVKRLMKTNWEQRIDLMFPDNPLWLADQKKGVNIYYSDTFVEVIEGTMVLPKNKGAGVENIKKLGTIMGFTAASYSGYIDKGKVEIKEGYDSLNLLRMARLGRIDGAYMAVDCAYHILKEVIKQPDALVFDPGLPYDKYAYLVSTTKHPGLVDKFDKFIAEENIMIRRLIKKYQVFVSE